MALSLSIPFSSAEEFPDWGRMEEEGEFIEVEKGVYKKGETVKIALRNDGNLTHHPMAQHVKILHIDTDRLMFDGGDVEDVLPMVPSEEVMEWNQTDQDGDEVPTGQYSVIFQTRYNANFTIEEGTDGNATSLNFIVFGTALIGAMVVYYKYKK
ncbi:MAG: hypothetical protein R6U17_08180 [Thermoplasmata archaeon]